MKKGYAAVALTVLLAACATHIADRNETIQPSKVPLGSFESIALKPLAIEKTTEGDASAATQRIDTELRNCMLAAFQGRKEVAVAEAGSGKVLLIEPSIVDIKKVNGAQRFFFGAMAGSSAVLLKVSFNDAAAHQTVAEPIFYAKANAMGAAWTFGAMDNLMLTRIVNNACDYARSNL